MTISIEYPHTGTVRIFRRLNQAEVNKLITHLSYLQETEGEVDLKITVED